MAKKIFGLPKKVIIVALLVFIVVVVIQKSSKYSEGYVVVAGAPATRARARVRADARTYTGPGDAVTGPVAPARRARRRAVVWYNPYTWF